MGFTYVTDTLGRNEALYRVTHGLYVVATRADERINGQVVDALMQVTNAPPRVVLGIGKQSLTYEMIGQSGQFVVSVLDRENPACSGLIRRFGFQSGRKVDKFEGLRHEQTEAGLPFLPDAVAIYECTVVPEMSQDLGTHMLWVASVDRAGTREGGTPLTYTEYRERLRQKGA